MGESLLLITIVTLIVITIRRARPVVLESPVIIQRPGQYHITLAPQLNSAQIFIEQIATRFSKSYSFPGGDLPSRYFEVRDPKVFARGADCYFLAVTLRDGLLYFQAVNPVKSQNEKNEHLNAIVEFPEVLLKQHPHTDTAREAAEVMLADAVRTVAKELQIEVRTLI